MKKLTLLLTVLATLLLMPALTACGNDDEPEMNAGPYEAQFQGTLSGSDYFQATITKGPQDNDVLHFGDGLPVVVFFSKSDLKGISYQTGDKMRFNVRSYRYRNDGISTNIRYYYIELTVL